MKCLLGMLKRGSEDEEDEDISWGRTCGITHHGLGLGRVHGDCDLPSDARVLCRADGALRRIHRPLLRGLRPRGSRVKQVGGRLFGLFRLCTDPRI